MNRSQRRANRGSGNNRAWTEGDVKNVLCNPLYAGVGAPGIIEESMFARAFLDQCREDGATTTLQRAWDELTKALGIHAALPDRETWVSRWSPQITDPAVVLDMLTELRRIYGGQPIWES